MRPFTLGAWNALFTHVSRSSATQLWCTKKASCVLNLDLCEGFSLPLAATLMSSSLSGIGLNNECCCVSAIFPAEMPVSDRAIYLSSKLNLGIFRRAKWAEESSLQVLLLSSKDRWVSAVNWSSWSIVILELLFWDWRLWALESVDPLYFLDNPSYSCVTSVIFSDQFQTRFSKILILKITQDYFLTHKYQWL